MKFCMPSEYRILSFNARATEADLKFYNPQSEL